MSIPENHGVLSAHRRAFSMAAKRGNVAIAVRNTNATSMRHIGQGYAAGKRIDCKAKTTDDRFFAPDGREIPGGLVGAPNLVGKDAYKGEKRLKFDSKVLGTWNAFARDMLRPEIDSEEKMNAMTYVPRGGQYYVEHRVGDPFWGCVKFTPTSQLHPDAGKPIHGDYDLYDIVPMEDPSVNTRAWHGTGAGRDGLAGQVHGKGRYFTDVQNWVNSAIGYPMILHGSEAKYAREHTDEGIVFFFPDGRFARYDGRAEIEKLYSSTFKGRKLFESNPGKEAGFIPYHTA